MVFALQSFNFLVELTSRSLTPRPQLQALNDCIQTVQARRYLEIGSFEGRSALLFSAFAACSASQQYIHVTCVDSWEGGDEHRHGDVPMNTVEARFDQVIAHCREWLDPGSQIEKIKALSVDGLRSIADRKDYYDLILIDAGHKAKDVLVDLVSAWPLLRPGGIMILDDYTWMPRHVGTSLQLNSPKLGIDAFCSCYADELTIISQMPLLQLYLLKESPLSQGGYFRCIRSAELPDLLGKSSLF